jgi:MIP family channel proteins
MAKSEVMHDRGMVVVKLRSPATTLKDELASAEARRALMGEFLGSLLFVLFGAGMVALTGGYMAERLDSARLLVIALAHGVAFTLLVAATLPISGGHLNPAVTFAAMVSRRTSFAKGLLYMVAQSAGAVAGALLLTLVIPAGAYGNLGANMLGLKVSLGSGLTTEIVVTFVLVSAMLATSMTMSRPAAAGLAVVGLTCVLAHLFAVPLTGGSMNPARSFGPAFVTGAWKDQWIFSVGPLAGAALAACVHELFAPHDKR